MHSTWFWLAVLFVWAQLIKPSHTLLDSGLPTSEGSSRTETAKQAEQVRLAAPRVASAGSLVLQDTSQLRVRPGCRRSTDFFDRVCRNPFKGPIQADDTRPSSRIVPGITADLLVCDIPEVEPLIRPDVSAQTGARVPSATYAVSGTIVVHGDGTSPPSVGDRLPELGDSGSHRDQADDLRGAVAYGTSRQADGSYPGPNDDGFWRQRNGQHEWHPATKDASQQPQATPDVKTQDASRLSEYDAWSAEQEQGAFLSFTEWKERHARDAAGHVKGSSSSTARTVAQDRTTEAQSDSPDSIEPPRLTAAYSEATNLKAGTPQGIAPTTHLSDGIISSTLSAPTASAPGQVHSTQTSEAPSADRSSNGGSDSSADSMSAPIKMGFSVAAGDTGSQLSKLKHRWNFASLDCAAVVHRTNPEAKFASSILSEKKDRYMLSPCPHSGGKLKGGRQFVIVELCEEIEIDTIVLANYEFFSNMFKKFTVTAAKQLTGRENDWTQLGVFRARNVRGQQVFRIPSAPRSKAFFRYIRIDFLEHFGSEFYCPVSLLRVYGITEMEEFKRGFEDHGEELDLGADVGEREQESTDESQEASLSSADTAPPGVPMARETSPSLENSNLTAQDEDIWRKHEQAFQRKLQNQSVSDEGAETDVGEALGSHYDTVSSNASVSQKEQHSSSTPSLRLASESGEVARNVDTAQCALDDDPEVKALNEDICIRPREESRPFYHLILVRRRTTEAKHTPIALDAASATRPNRASNSTPAKLRSASAVGEGVEVEIDRGRRANSPRPVQSGTSGTESVYRAIHRRLNALESNATLSHSYIEHSGQMLREVFARMEKRQESRMSDMLRALNASNWHQIESLKRRQHVDLQRAIFEFDVHRQQADNERRALLREVQLLAEEVLLEKRLSIAQLIMLLIVFVFVGMTRGSRAVPLLHAGFNKIGRSSKRREAKADGQSVVPTSPVRATARMQSSTEVKQPLVPSSRDSMSTQPRIEPSPETGTGLGSTPQRPRIDFETATPAVQAHPLPLGSSPSGIAAIPKPTRQSQQKSRGKAAINSFAGRADPNGEAVIAMLSHPRIRGRLVMLLETLDALDRAAGRRRLPKSVPLHRTTARRHRVGEKAINATPASRSGPDPSVVSFADLTGRTSRSHRPTFTHKQEQSFTNGRRLGTPGRDKRPGGSGFDDVAGMSSDWTERSENGDASENAAYLSDDEDIAIRAAKSDMISLEPVEALAVSKPSTRLGPHDDFGNGHASNDPAEPVPPRIIADRAGSDPEHDKHIAVVAELPSIARADGHLSSSDSESEGGAWHRVLPRRIGNSNSIRRARQGTIDGKTHKTEGDVKLSTKSEALERRGSPRPSSAQGAALKAQKAALSRIFWTGTPELGGSESPRQWRSGTPDTIRDLKTA